MNRRTFLTGTAAAGTTPGRSPEGALDRETYAACSDFFDRPLDPAGIDTLPGRIGAARGASGAAARSWLTETHRAMRPHASGAAHQNYADPDLTDWRRAHYGDAAPRRPG